MGPLSQRTAPTLLTLTIPGNLCSEAHQIISLWREFKSLKIIWLSYFLSNYATAGTLSYTIKKCSCGNNLRVCYVFHTNFLISDICRIRLDYESFVLDGPTTPIAANQATSEQCATDVMTVGVVGIENIIWVLVILDSNHRQNLNTNCWGDGNIWALPVHMWD